MRVVPYMLAVAVLALTAWAGWTILGLGERPPAPPRLQDDTRNPPLRDGRGPDGQLSAPLPDPDPHQAEPPRGPVGPDGPIEVKPGEEAVDPGLVGAIDRFVEAVPVGVPGAGSVDALVARALAQGKALDILAFRQDLERLLDLEPGRLPEAASLLVKGLAAPEAEPLRFAVALALMSRLDERSARILLDGLGSAPDAVRPHLVSALYGAADGEVDRRFASLYDADPDPAVRAAAALGLARRAETLPSPLLARARAAAWRDMAGEEPRLLEAAADVLGIPPLAEGDQERLLAIVRSDTHAPRRGAALRALASSGADPELVTGVLRQLADDPQAPEELRRTARSVLAARERIFSPGFRPPPLEEEDE